MYVRFDVVKKLGDFTLEASGELREGLTCVVGPNGSGKTTLLKILAGLLKPDRGAVEYVGVGVKTYVGELYVPPDATALEVALAGRSRFSSLPMGKKDEEAARRYMRLLEVEDFAERRWRTLSGGQRQRVVIAAALASEADLLLLDEPLASLHGDWRGRVMKTLTDYGTGRIVVVTTHHGDVLKCCRALIALKEGRVAWHGDPQQYAEPLDTACG
jgi:ABC-type cobalamin/Fe3+-siderophores transport systems, ATPase components